MNDDFTGERHFFQYKLRGLNDPEFPDLTVEIHLQEGETITEMLLAYKSYLRAVGYQINGDFCHLTDEEINLVEQFRINNISLKDVIDNSKNHSKRMRIIKN